MKRALFILSFLSSIGIIAYGVNSAVPSQNTYTPIDTVNPQVVENIQVAEPVIRTENVTVTEKIAYTTVTQEDDTLASGTTKILTEGANGERTKVYKVTYEDDKEIGRDLISSTVTREPVDRVIINGTYVAPAYSNNSTSCQNGTYTNVDGNVVCRPSTNNTGGATAICRDGTYSYSQHRSGTCSHHGGVSTWL